MEPTTNDPKAFSKGEWQWKSNSDPWSKTEEPQWTSYSSEDNYLIEKAYYDQQKEVDLGDYIVSIHHMTQKKKDVITSQRPIRRINVEDKEEMNLRSERYFETELPKSINQVFGSLKDFINFFSRRNPEISDLTRQFQGFEQSNDLNGLKKNIYPQLICYLEEELIKSIESQLNDASVLEDEKISLRKRKKKNEALIFLFKTTDFASFDEFYGLVLRSYTMVTDLYRNLNQYLRNESWAAIDNLLPYTVCLCQAFFRFKSRQIKSSITLYRGTALDEEALKCYNTPEALRVFSWNSVTSTSKDKKIAEKFMYNNASIKDKKYPVLFIIEIPPENSVVNSEYLKWIDIRQYSALPKEDEVILAPGCTFELAEVLTDQEQRTIIKLTLRHEIESLAFGGLMMQGALQTQMMSDKQARIMCLEREELSEAFKTISGNRLIEEIEFYLCTFDNQSFKRMLKTLTTLEKAQALKFVSCKHEDEEGVSNLRLKGLKSCNILRVEIFEAQYFFKILCSPKESGQYWMSLRELSLDFRSIKTNTFVLQELGHLSQLESLALDFEFNQAFTDQGVENLASQGLRYLTQITSLTLNFTRCEEISNKGIKSLASQGIKYLTQLSSLSLVFACCALITEEGVEALAYQGLKYLTKLTFLNLNLSVCPEIGEKGLYKLASQGLKYLTQLINLTLNFEGCSGIEKGAVNDLVTEGLNFLTRLTFLNLNLAFWSIADQGINNLASRGFKYLTQLASLSLDFSDRFGITNVGVNNLASGLKNLIQLTSLALNFSKCTITDKGVTDLALQGLQYLTKLQSLSLNFIGCERVTDNGMKNLTSYGLKYLPSLTSLVLEVSRCPSTTDEGLTDEGVYHFASQGLRSLTQLASLTMSFICCEKITNKGVESLASQGIKYLTQLTSLTLSHGKFFPLQIFFDFTNLH